MTAPPVTALGTADAGEMLTLQRAAYVSEARRHDDLDLPPLTESPAGLVAALSEDGLRAWGVREHGRLVAAVRVLVRGPVAELGRLAVVPDSQGRGLGSHLLRHVESHLPPGVTGIELFTGEHSGPTLRLYHRHGYRETGRTRAGHYDLVHLRKAVRPLGPADGADRAEGVDDVERFVADFARALVGRDEVACAALWGRAATVVADGFETAVADPADLEPFLARAWPVYDHLGVARIDHTILERVELTGAITRVRVRYAFRDGTGALLTDGEFEYVLRREDGRLRCHVGVNISAEPNLAALARERGYRPG